MEFAGEWRKQKEVEVRLLDLLEGHTEELQREGTVKEFMESDKKIWAAALYID